ncbi:MAG: hypothetical protein II960_10005 [Synergistaceae bacterium]|nr:hypothetical protein [Synergistaceae bacterium]
MKKLLVVLSVVLVLAFASGAFAAREGESGHVGHEDTTVLLSKGASAFSSGLSSAAATALTNSSWAGATPLTTSTGSANATTIDNGAETNEVVAAYIPKFNVPGDGEYIIGVYLNLYDLQSMSAITSFILRALNSAFTGTISNTALLYLDESVTPNVMKQVSSLTDVAKLDVTSETYLYFEVSGLGAASSSVEASATQELESGLYAAGSGGPLNIGSSGGGCVAGTSALALAVLGLFIAKGKK